MPLRGALAIFLQPNPRGRSRRPASSLRDIQAILGGHEFHHAVEFIKAEPCCTADPEACARETETKVSEELRRGGNDSE